MSINQSVYKMREFEKGLPAVMLRRMFAYDPKSGNLIWKECLGPAPYKARKRGKTAGCLNGQGYVVVKIQKRLVRAHRIIWAMQTGRWPKHFIDHENGVKNDNRWINLRSATFTENGLNKKEVCGISGLRRVVWNKSTNKWLARVKVNGKLHHLGSFINKNEAFVVASTAAARMQGQFARFD